MAAEAVWYQRDEDGVVTLMLDQPNSSVNLMNPDFAESIKRCVDRLEEEIDQVRGVLVRSAKLTFFAGADLNLLYDVTTETVDEFAPFIDGVKASLRRLERIGRPVASVITGAALGGGLEVALGTHRRFGVDDRSVRVGFPEVTLGLLPGAGGVTRLVRMLGLQQALPLLLQGTRLRADEAHQAGILDDVAENAEDALARARAWVLAPDADPIQPWDRADFTIPDLHPFDPASYSTLAAAPAMLHQKTRGAMPASRKILAAAVEGSHVDTDTALRVESRYFLELLTGSTAKNMMATFWFGLNDVNGGAARPTGYDSARVTQVGVLGAGMMGTGIAYVSACAGVDVVLTDTTQERASAGKERIATLLGERVNAGKLTVQHRDDVLDRVVATVDHAELVGCELVIEAVFEDRAVKKQMLASAASAAPPDAVIASNTSTLPITGLAESVSEPAGFVGLHFFSPVPKMPLVEIIRGQRTSDQTLARAFDFVRQISKTPIVVNDSRGFFTSRVFGSYITEGIAMVSEGVPPALVENVACQTGMPMGPLAVADEVSLALLWQIRSQEIADGATTAEHPAHSVLRTMVELGRAGKAVGAGFYDYPAGAGTAGEGTGATRSVGSKRLWPELGVWFASQAGQAGTGANGDQLGRAPSPVPMHDVRDRLLFAQAVETRRCLTEGVLTSPRDADIASVLGIGFPAWTGGAARFADAYGDDAFTRRAEELATRYGHRFAP